VNVLITNAILYGVILSMVLVIIMTISVLLAPDIWVGDYPPDVKEKYGPMSEKARKLRPYIAIPFFLAMLLFPLLALFMLESRTAESINFGSAWLSSFLVLIVFNLIDLLILDWLVFSTLQPKLMVLPGTEGMPGYRDYRFHFIGFLKGVGFCIFGGLLLTGIWFLIQLIF
jgi:hypothetical protein